MPSAAFCLPAAPCQPAAAPLPAASCRRALRAQPTAARLPTDSRLPPPRLPPPRLLTALAALALLAPLLPAPVTAATHDIVVTSVVAEWHNPRSANPNAPDQPQIRQGDGNGTPAEIYWSTPMHWSIPSGFVFTPPANGTPGHVGEDLVLGRMTLLNGVVSAFGFVLDRVELHLTVAGHLNGPDNTPFSLPLAFAVTHEESPNQVPLARCPAYQITTTPCDDKVTLTPLAPARIEVPNGSATYTLEALGFGQDGRIASSFVTEEQTETDITLHARLTRQGSAHVIPLPAGLPLLLGALGLLALQRRRRP